MFTLHDRKAIVTGAGTGIGAASARLFAKAGAELVLVGRRVEKLEEVAREIEADSGRAHCVAADLSVAGEAERVVAEAAERMGGLDLLFNNAALYRAAPVSEISDGDWQAHLDLNLSAPLWLCRSAYPWLRRSEAGVVLNCLSTLAQRPVAGVAAYSASKAALLSLTQTLALEWAPDGIRVVAVSPGVVQTPIHGGADLAPMAALHPLGRVGRAEEIAAAALFLASDESAWTTGTVLTVDGGIHLA